MYKILRKDYERIQGREKEEKKLYEKPELTRHGKLTDMVAGGLSPNGNDIVKP